MDSKETNKCSYQEKGKAAMQLRRRDTYDQISAHRREARLLSRRMRKQNLSGHSLLQNANVNVAQQATSSWYKAGFPNQTPLMIRETPPLLEKAASHELCAPALHGDSGKGKRICTPFVIHETGCTSCTSNQGLVAVDKVPTEGHRQTKKRRVAINEQQTEYVALKKVPNCQYCGAKKFKYEPPGFCCSKGSIRLTSQKLPAELSKLYFENAEESQHFRTYIRTYNNMFAFTSLGVRYDKDLAKRNRGIYTFRVQGRMYHFIDDLLPSNKKPRNLQLYFYDNDNELANMMAYSTKINESIVQKLMNILNVNPYSIFLRSLLNVPQLSDWYIVLKCDSSLDQRTYNLPTTSEIAAIWPEANLMETISAPHIRIYPHSDRAQLINYYYGCYDPLQYPLLFPYGEN